MKAFERFEQALAAEAKSKPKKPIIGIQVDTELHEALRGLAKADNRTLASYCRYVLFRHVEGAPAKGKVAPFHRHREGISPNRL